VNNNEVIRIKMVKFIVNQLLEIST
jgi:hypothetical protein